MAELEEGSKAIAMGGKATNEVFAHPLPFNVIPHIDKFLDDQYTKEERKVTWETRKIMGLPDLPVSCTCVRIPTLRAHAEAITIETEKPVDIAKARACLESATGVELVDDPANLSYPMPMNATAKYDVEVGRLRKNDVFGENGLDLFVCGDQLLRGAALNAVLIAEAVC
jgi:aspartate-semialdehyde dehydrogenase